MSKINWLAIDVPICSLTFGQTTEAGTCPATGVPCYNSRATCKAFEAYTETITRAFFTDASQDVIPQFGGVYGDAIPICNIRSVSMTPARVEIGEGFGARASLSVSFADHPTSDLQPYEDKYTSQRGGNAFYRGTFWHKFLARHPFLRGQEVRWAVVDSQITGLQNFPQDAKIFLVDSFSGPDVRGAVSLKCKDPLTLLDEKNAVIPRLSRGQLEVAINESQTNATLAPAGIGNAEYPESGFINIGGEEIVSFTRVNDSLTIVRARLGTTASAHDAEDRCQLVVNYSSVEISDILYDVLSNYTKLSENYLALQQWKDQTVSFIDKLYSGVIPEPTPVKKIVSELMRESVTTMWFDGSIVRLQVLRNFNSVTTYDDDVMIEDTFTKKEQPEKRISQVWVYYGKKNPLEAEDDPKNYSLCLVTAQSVVADLEARYNNIPIIREVFSRWINRLQRPAAERISDVLLSRFSDPPRSFRFSLLRDAYNIKPALMQTADLNSFHLQDASGASGGTKIQLTQITETTSGFDVMAEEFLFEGEEEDPNIKVLTVDGEVTDINLRNEFLPIYGEIRDGQEVRLIVSSGGVIGGTQNDNGGNATAALDIGTGWPNDISYTIRVIVRPGGFIVGKAGEGGQLNGTRGGLAIRTTVPISIDNDGIIGGGGGGGGQARLDGRTTFYIQYGSGGAGFVFGQAGVTGGVTGGGLATAGNPTVSYDVPGSAKVFSNALGTMNGGGGGLLGQTSPVQPAASSFNPGTGVNGLPGRAIVGIDHCTISGTGDILGQTE